MKKKRKYYLVLSRKNRHIYGAFERNKGGLEEAKKYKEKLKKEHKTDYVIK